MLLTWVIDRLAELRLSPKVILKRRHHIYHLESKVYDFYKHHPAAFFLMIACNLLAHVASVVEVYLALKMLGFQSAGGPGLHHRVADESNQLCVCVCSRNNRSL